MRTAIIVLGIVLIGLGAVIGFGHLKYPDEKSVVKLGAISAVMTRERPVPAWLGGVTALTGLAIALLGTKYRR
jgi:hypothetical protein